MTEERTTTIEFQGEPITVLIENDRPYVAIKLESDSKIAKLRDCERWKGLRPLTCFSLLITNFNS